MQIDEFMAEPTGVGGDALLSTVVNHVASREGPIEASELEMIFGIIASLQGRVTPEAMMIATAKLSALRTAQEMQTMPERQPVPQPAMQPKVQLALTPEIMQPEIVSQEIPEEAVLDSILHDPLPEQCPAPDMLDRVEAIAFEPVVSSFANLPQAQMHVFDAPEPEMQEPEMQEPEMQETAIPEPAADPAGPVLQHAPLPEPMIVSLAAQSPEEMAAICAPERLAALAVRPNPSERLCSMIVSRGHAEALVAILRNPQARFAKSSLTTMVELAASDMSLREAMCARPDLTDMILDRLWPYLSQGSRAAVLAAGCADAHAEALVICADAAAEEACEISEDESLRSIADWSMLVRNREESLSHAMRTLDQEGRIVDVAAMLAEFAGIAPAMALALMIGTYDRGAVALARLAGCDDDSMMSLIHLRARAGARTTADRRGPLHAFAKITEDEARHIIRGCFARLARGSTATENQHGQDDEARAAA